MNRIVLLLFGVILTNNLFSQKAAYQKAVTEGNFLFLEKNYDMALQSYKQAYAIDSANANINYKVGLVYMFLPSKKKKAMPYMEKAITNVSKNYHEDEPGEKAAPKDAYYYYGKALHLSGKYEEAIVQFEKYKQLIGHDKDRAIEVQRQIETCRNAVLLTKNPESILIKNLGDSINTEYADYVPVINADESVLMYTSRRPGSTGGERGTDNSFYDDIYMSKRRSDGAWGYPTNFLPGLNTNSNEATIGLSADGQKLYIYKDVNGGDIFYTTLNGGSWSAPVPFGDEINSPNFETHLTISTDSSVMYFSGERPGGKGGVDIYRCTKLPNGHWSAAYLLDSAINTRYNEDSPYLHPDGKKLFFSSEGHNSMGGLDIFYTLISNDSNGNIVYSAPINLRAPINTADDDEFYVPTADGIHAYFSSAREGGYGDQDIYIADLPKDIQVDPLVLLKGIVTFDGVHDRPEKVEISIFDVETNQLVAKCKPNALTGKYLAILMRLGKKFLIKYEATGFQPTQQTVDVLPGSAYRVVEKEVEFEYMNMESKAATTISMGGLITNEDLESILDVQVVVKDNNTGELIKTYTTSSDVGYYYLVLDRGRNYNISFEAPGYLFQSQNVDIPKKAGSEHVEILKSIKLERIHSGVKMTLNNIFFDKMKATLRKQSMTEMETVYKLLKEHPDLVIEVSGHTDNAGNAAVNKKLSLDRAKAVVTFLTKKGIPAKQLIAKGYGSTQPVADNKLPNGKPNLEGMQKNRRVELKIENAKE